MPFCTECGTANDAAVKFCTSCGARLEPAPQTRPIESGIAGVGRATELSGGEILILAGAAVALLSFFLPWLSTPTGMGMFGGLGGWGGGMRSESISGVGLFRVAGAWVLLVPLLAALAAAFVFLFRESPRAVRLQATGWQIFLASPSVVSGISILFVPMLPSILSVGYYGSTLGYLSILVGSFCVLNQLSRKA